MKQLKKVLAMFLCLSMCLSLFPTWAFAEGESGESAEGIGVTETAETVSEEPAYEEVPAEEPVYEEPVYEEPVTETPVTQESVVQEPVTETLVTQEPAAETPVNQELVTETPVTQEPAAAEPVRVVFRFDETVGEGSVRIYTKDENALETEISAEEDGSYFVLPGQYYYTAQAEGFAEIGETELTVETTEETVTVSLEMEEVLRGEGLDTAAAEAMKTAETETLAGEEVFFFAPEESGLYGDLLRAYAEQELEKARALHSGEFQLDVTDWTAGLNGPQTEVFSVLKECVERTAAGDRFSTSYAVDFDNSLSAEALTCSPAELEYESFTTDNLNAAVEKAYLSRLSFGPVYEALVNALHNELYWFDSSFGVVMTCSYRCVKIDDEIVSITITGVTYHFAVSEPFAIGENYAADSSGSVIQSEAGKACPTCVDYTGLMIHKAIMNAQDVIAMYNDLDDAEKLRSYKDWLCRELSYYNLGTAWMDDSDPWQVIHVFDSMPDTNGGTVCYARAFEYLCALTDFNDPQIRCRVVSGTVVGGVDVGMWNVVTMDDGYNYLVDVANCDGETEHVSDCVFLKGSTYGDASSGYSIFPDGIEFTYVYDDETRAQYDERELVLSDHDYGDTSGELVDNHLSVSAVGETQKYAAIGSQVTMQVTATADDPSGITYEWSKYDEDTNGYIRNLGDTDSLTVTAEKTEAYYVWVYDGYGNSQSVTFVVNLVDSTFLSADELAALCDNVYPEMTTVTYAGAEVLVISENLTIPENLRVMAGTGKVLVNSGASLTVNGMLVAGGLYANGILTVNSYMGLRVQEILSVTGTIQLNNRADFSARAWNPDCYNHISFGENADLVIFHEVSSGEELKAEAESAETGLNGLRHDIIARGAISITTDTMVPESVCLHFEDDLQNGVRLTVAEGVVLTLCDGAYLNAVNVPVQIDGTLVNNSGLELHGENAVLSLGNGGSYEGMAEIRVYDINSPDSLLPESVLRRYERQTEDGGYVYIYHQENVSFAYAQELIGDDRFELEGNPETVRYYRFSPTRSADYKLFSEWGWETEIILYGVDQTVLQTNQNGAGRYGTLLSAYLEAGQTYYYSVRYISYDGTSPFRFCFDNKFSAERDSASFSTVLPGERAVLKVSLNGTDLEGVTYRWYVSSNESGNYAETLLESETGESLTTEPIQKYTLYRCTVTDRYGNSQTVWFNVRVNNAFRVTADGNTQVYVQPGETATLKVTVAGNNLEGASYQWYQQTIRNDGTYSYTEMVAIEGETGDTLTTEPIQKYSQYEFRATDQYGNSQTVRFTVRVDNGFSVTADGNTEVYVQPRETATLKVAATGNNLEGASYQWYKQTVRNDGSYSYTEMVAIEGETGDTLTTEPIQKYTQYQCTATDQYGNSHTVWFSVRVDNGFSVTADGGDQVYVQPGETAVLKVTATGNDLDRVTYRWYIFNNKTGGYNELSLEGEPSDSLTTEPIQCAMDYICRIIDKYGNQQEVWFRISVDNGFSVTADGDTWVYVQPGETAELKAIVKGNNLEGASYQWYKQTVRNDGSYSYTEMAAIEGETGDTLTTEPIQKYSQYEFRVTDQYGNSQTVRFYVGIDNAFRVKAEGNTDIYAQLGETATLKVTASGNDLDGVTYKWYKQSAALEGEADNSLTTEPIQKYTQYQCTATDRYGNSQTVWFYVQVENGFSVTADGGDQVYVQPGETATLKVAAIGNNLEELTYCWYETSNEPGNYRDTFLEGETGDSLVTEPIQKYTQYRCTVTDPYGNLQTVWFNVGVDNAFRVTADGSDQVYVQPGGTATLKVMVTGNNLEGLTYRWYETSNEPGNYRDTFLEDETGDSLTTEPIQQFTQYYCNVTDQYGNQQYVYFQVSIDNAFRVTPEGNTQVYVQSGETATLKVSVSGNDLEGLTYQWYRMINRYDGAYQYTDRVAVEGETGDSLVTEAIQGYTEYYCIATDRFGNSQTAVFFVGIENAFRATEDGNNHVYVQSGETATLKVSVSGNDLEGLTYQWYRMIDRYDGAYQRVAVEGETGDSLITDAIQKYTQYICRVTDKYGNQQEVWFWVSIDNAFRVTPEGNTQVYVQPGETATLKVSVSGNDLEGLTYQWYRMINRYDGAYQYTDRVAVEGKTGDSLITDAIQKYTQYICCVTDKYGNQQEVWFRVSIDNAFRVTANGNKQVYVQPGETATLKVVVSGNDLEGVTYQWYQPITRYDGANYYYERPVLGGETGESLITEPVHAYTEYECVVTDRYGNEQTVPFSVTIDNGLTAAPVGAANLSLPYNATFTLEVDALANDMEGLQYRWAKYVYENHAGYAVPARAVAVAAAPAVAATAVAARPAGVSAVAGNWLDESGDTLTDSVTGRVRYTCLVTDKYGNSITVIFNVGVDNQLKAYIDGTEEKTDVTYYLSSGESRTLKANVSAANMDGMTLEWWRFFIHKGESGGTASEPFAVNVTELSSDALTDDLDGIIYQLQIRDRYNNTAFLSFKIRPFTHSCGAEGDNVTWSFDESTGILSFSGTGDMADSMGAWETYKDRITAVVFSDGVTGVGAYTFSNFTGLTGVTLPEGVRSISFSSFEGCTGLTDITLPEGLESIGRRAFSNTGITKISIPNSIAKLEYGTFENCSSLAAVNLPANLEEIGERAFADNTSLSEITIPVSTARILPDAFSGCVNLSKVYYDGTQEQWNAIEIGNGNDPLLNARLILLQTMRPEQITGVSAVGYVNSVIVSWGISTEIATDTYRIYRSETGEEGDVSLVAEISGRNHTSYTDTDVVPGTEYTYFVTGVNGDGLESLPGSRASASALSDAEKPQVLTLLPKNGSILSGTIVLSMTAKDNTAVSRAELAISTDGGNTWSALAEKSDTDVSAFSVSLDTRAYLDGEIRIRARAFDETGNESTPMISRFFLDNTGPEKISGLTATSTSVTVTLSWENVLDADVASFRVEEKNKVGGYRVIAATNSTLGINLSDLIPDTAHTYRVTALDAQGNIGTPSDDISVRTQPDTLAPVITKIRPLSGFYAGEIPVSVTAQDDYRVAGITLQTSQDNIFWSDVKTETYPADTEHTMNHTLTLAGYAEGDLYIRAVASDAAGNLSSTGEDAPYVQHIVDRTPPAAPTVERATGGSGTIEIVWQQGTETDLTTYSVCRATEEAGSYETVATGLRVLNFFDRSVQQNTVYYYKVRVQDQAGNVSAWSEPVSAQAEPDTLAPEVIGILPVDGSLVGGSFQTVRVGAQDNLRLDRVLIEYSTDNETYSVLKEQAEIASPAGTVSAALPLESLQTGEILWIRAKAIDEEGLESDAATAQYTVDLESPAVLSVQAVYDEEDDSVLLTWTGGQETDLAGYRIYRRTADSSFSLIAQKAAQEERAEYSFRDYDLGTAAGVFIYRVEAMDRIGNTGVLETGGTETGGEEIGESGTVQTLVPDRNTPRASLEFDAVQEVGKEYLFDASDSVDNVEIRSYVFDFGDGSVVTDKTKAVHRYAEVGTYTVTLTVTDNEDNEATVTKTVDVVERTSVGIVRITVVDENGEPIPFAPVYFDLGEVSQVKRSADGNGTAEFTARAGRHTVGSVIADNEWLPVKREIVVVEGQTVSAVLTLAHQTMIEGEFEIHRMSFEEIKAAGIDVSDPENQHQVKINVSLTYGSQKLEIPVIYNTITGVTWDDHPISILDSLGRGRRLSTHVIERKGGEGGSTDVYDGSGTHHIGPGGGTLDFWSEEEEPLTIAVLDVPIEASFLKEFFDVNLFIINNAGVEFSMLDNLVTLNIPDGLTLMETNGSSAGAAVKIPEIAGQSTQKITWILRGDRQGEYEISADYVGTLAEFNEPIAARFEAQDPIKVHGLSGMKLTAEFISQVYFDGFYFNLSLENISDVDYYLPSVGIEDNLISSYLYSVDGNGAKNSKVVLLSTVFSNSSGFSQVIPNGQKITTLSPGERLTRKFAVYNAAGFNDLLYFRSAVETVTEGFGIPYDIVVVDMDLYSLTDAQNKLARIRDEKYSLYQELTNDFNFYYYLEGRVRDWKNQTSENYYSLAQNALNFDLNYTLDQYKQLALDRVQTLLKDESLQQAVEEKIDTKWPDILDRTYRSMHDALERKFSAEDLWILEEYFADENNRSKMTTILQKRKGSEFKETLLDELLARGLSSEGGRTFENTVGSEAFAATFLSDLGDLYISASNVVSLITGVPSEWDEAKALAEQLVEISSAQEEAEWLLDSLIRSLKSGGASEIDEEKTADLEGFRVEDVLYTELLFIRGKLGIAQQMLMEQFRQNLKEQAFEKLTGFGVTKLIDKAFGSEGEIVFNIVTEAFNLASEELGWEETFRGSQSLYVDIALTEAMTRMLSEKDLRAQNDEEAQEILREIKYLVKMRILSEENYVDIMKREDEDEQEKVLSLMHDKFKGNYETLDDFLSARIADILKMRDSLFSELSYSVRTPSAPKVTIDILNSRTAESFSSKYEYSFDGSSWQTCTGNSIPVEAGNVIGWLYVRERESDDNVAGNIARTVIPARPRLQGDFRVLRTDEEYRISGLPEGSYFYCFSDNREEAVFSDESIFAVTADETVILPQSTKYTYLVLKKAVSETEFASLECWLVVREQELRIVTQPTRTVAAAGSQVRFAVEAVGNGLTYRWYSMGPDDEAWAEAVGDHTDEVYTLTAEGSLHNHSYVCEVTDASGNNLFSDAAVLVVTASEVNLDSSTFPDEMFRNYIFENCDGDKDSRLDASEIAAVRVINVNGKNIVSIKGLEIFTELKELYCADNSLTSLNLGNNMKLERLVCFGNRISTLNISGCPRLLDTLEKSADMLNQNGTIHNWTNDAELHRDAATMLITGDGVAVDAVNFPDAGFRIYVAENFDRNGTNTLDANEIANVTAMDLNGTSADLKGIEYFPGLESLSLSNSALATLDLSANQQLEELVCEDNEKLTTVDLSHNTALKTLQLYNNNKLNKLDLSANENLEVLRCGNLALTALNLSQNTALNELKVKGTKISNLDLSNNTKLKDAQISDTPLTVFTPSVALVDLRLNNTRLARQNLSSCKELVSLAVTKNSSLTALDISGSAELKYLDCSGNRLATLDVSANGKLYSLDCSNNQLTTLTLGENSTLGTLNCSGNPKLASLSLDGCEGMKTRLSSSDRIVTRCNGIVTVRVSGQEILICDDTTKLDLVTEELSGTCGASSNGGNLTWTLDPAGTLSITGSGAMKNYTSENDVPWSPSKQSEIAPLQEPTAVKKVEIGSAVTTIGSYAFASCENLEEVHLSGRMPTIGANAFAGITAEVFYPGTLDYTRVKKSGYGESTPLEWTPEGGFTVTLLSNGGMFGVPAAEASEEELQAWNAALGTWEYQTSEGTLTRSKYFGEENVTMPVFEPTREGYVFQGWSQTATGGVRYKAGDAFNENADRTLYAVWKANTYQINFNSNIDAINENRELNGEETVTITGTMRAQNMNFGKAQSLTQSAYRYAGNSFTGWALTPKRALGGMVDFVNRENVTDEILIQKVRECTESPMEGEESFDFYNGFDDLFTGGEITLYAVWKATAVSITLYSGYEIADDNSLIQAGGPVPIIEGSTLTVDMNEMPTIELQAEVNPYDGNLATSAEQSVKWTTSSTAIATVDENGAVSFLKPGTVTITATTTDGSNKRATVKFSIYYIDPGNRLTASLAEMSEGYKVPTSIGLQRGDWAMLNIYGTDKTKPMDPDLFQYDIVTRDYKDYLEFMSNGWLTALNGGSKTFSVKVALLNDPLKRSVTVNVKTIDEQAKIIDMTKVTPENVSNPEDFYDSDEKTIYLEKQDYNQTLIIEPVIYGAAGSGNPFPLKNEKNVTQVTYASTNRAVAAPAEITRPNAAAGEIAGAVKVTVQKNATGAATITATSKDYAKTVGSLSIYVMDYEPRTDVKSVTIDTHMGTTAEIPLVVSNGNEITEVSFEEYSNSDRDFTPYNEETARLHVRPNPERTVNGELTTVKAELYATTGIPNGTIRGRLAVVTQKGTTYYYDLNVVSKSTLPSISIRQTPLNTFYKDSESTVTVTVRNTQVEWVELNAGTIFRSEGFYTDGENTVLPIRFDDAQEIFPTNGSTNAFNPTAAQKNGTLSIKLQGYVNPVQQPITIQTNNVRPALKLSAASTSLNTALDGNTATTTLVDNRTNEPYDLVISDPATQLTVGDRTPLAAVRNVGPTFMVELNTRNARGELQGGSVTMNVQDDNWTQAISYPFNVTVNTQIPRLTPAQGTLTLNKLFPEITASTNLNSNQGGTDFNRVYFKEDPNLTPAAAAGKLRADYDSSQGIITVCFTDESIAKGTYTLTFKPYYEDLYGNEYAIPTITLRVTVNDQQPTAALTPNSVSLSGFCGEDMATTAIKLNNDRLSIMDVMVRDTKGADIYDPNYTGDVPFDIRYENGSIVVRYRNEADPLLKAASYTYQLVAVMNEGAQTKDDGRLYVQLGRPVNLTVRTIDDRPALRLGKGTLTVNNAFGSADSTTVILINAAGQRISDLHFEPGNTSAAENFEKLSFAQTRAGGAVTGLTVRAPQEDNPTRYSVPVKITATVQREDGTTESKPITATVNVQNTTPNVTLASPTLTINRKLAVPAISTIKVPAGYDFVGFTEMEETGVYGDGYAILTLSKGRLQAELTPGVINQNRNGSYRFNLTPIVMDINTGITAECRTVRATVSNTSSDTWRINVAPSGKLDTVQRFSDEGKMIYTITGMNGIQGIPTSASLENVGDGRYASLFNVSGIQINDRGQAYVVLSLKAGVDYPTNVNYNKLKLRFTFADGTGEGIQVDSQELSLRVTQTALRLTAKESKQTVYQSQAKTRTVTYEIELTSPIEATMNDLNVTVGDIRQWQSALENPDEDIFFELKKNSYGRTLLVHVTLKDLAQLAAGRTYTLPILVKAEGAASNMAATTVNLNLAVQK